jgi:predicted Rossmann-fold nucleotide-binding protein
MSAGYVVLEGGTGTLTELAIVWEHVCKNLISPRPVFVVGEFWKPTVELLVAARPKCGLHVHQVTSPNEIVALIRSTPYAQMSADG